MSKIYQALEKAEKESEARLKKKFYPVIEPEEIRVDPPEEIPRPKMPERMISNLPLVTVSEPGSLVAEQFRKLRTYLIKLRILESYRTIMVTSAMDNEGKTFISTNLAAVIARDLHAHVLLIDCDMRKPSLLEYFGLPMRKGLSDYLVGKESVAQFILKTEIDKLSLLPGGSIPDNPSELIGSERMETLIQELKSRYQDRFLILDSTPLLATTEPEVITKLVDGILIVVRAGVTPRETIQQALQTMDREKIIGVVLNDVTFKAPGLYSRYFGSNGYYYRYSDRGRKQEPRDKGKRLPRWLVPWNRKSE
jgi:exopolysaccharide/PEP-CTERM locus tyrosine autokinase